MFKVPGKTKVSRIWVAYDAQTREQVLKRMEETAAALTPANFAAKARELSGDEKAKDGGDWGYWAWQNFTAQEKTMIDNLDASEISSPVDAGQGFSLLHVAEKVPETAGGIRRGQGAHPRRAGERKVEKAGHANGSPRPMKRSRRPTTSRRAPGSWPPRSWTAAC